MEHFVTDEQKRQFKARRWAIGTEREGLSQQIRASRTEQAEIEEERKRLKARKKELRQKEKDLTERRDKGLKQSLDQAVLSLSEPFMQDFCTDFCGKLPRELRDMVYHELLPEPSTHSSFSVDGIPRSWGVFGPAHLTKLGSDDSYTQIINEYTQVYYRDMCFRFYDGDIGLLPSFLDADPTESDIRPANLVRNIEIIVSKGVFIHLDTADQGESLPLDTYTMDISGKALCATLPELLRKINNQCRIVLRFEKDFHRVRKSPLRKVDHAHDLLKLFRSTRALLNRGPLAEIHFGQTKCSINPSASKPCEVFGQPVEEWAKEQQQLWEDLYKKVRLSKSRA